MIVETGFSWRGVFLYAAIGVALTLLQHTVTPYTGWFTPDFTLVLVVHAAFFRGVHEASTAALILGGVLDAVSGGIFGLYLFMRQLTLTAGRIVAGRLFSEGPLFQFPVVLGMSLFDGVATWLVLAAMTDAAPGFGGYLTRLPAAALASAAAAPPLTWALTHLYALPAFNLAKRGIQQ